MPYQAPAAGADARLTVKTERMWAPNRVTLYLVKPGTDLKAGARQLVGQLQSGEGVRREILSFDARLAAGVPLPLFFEYRYDAGSLRETGCNVDVTLTLDAGSRLRGGFHQGHARLLPPVLCHRQGRLSARDAGSEEIASAGRAGSYLPGRGEETMAKPEVRKRDDYVPLTKEQFRERFYARYYDPAFDAVKQELERVFEAAWDGYIKYRKSPRTRVAGPGFAKPERALPVEWLEARAAVQAAEKRQKDAASPSRILVVSGSTRSEHTCPGEISKTSRLAQHAQKTIEALRGFEVDFLDVSDLADEPYHVIYPCKACVSTAQPLCHWPCSCYPNHAIGQVNDWMNEVYPRWVAAHGVMVCCPVNWYHVPASFKLMMDRLVCADGGNPDPTSTNGKDPAAAKELELAGWDYPKHLAGRAFGVVVHGDAAGPENVRRMLTDWLTDMELIPATRTALIDTWIGWYEPYATSHQELDQDKEIFEEVKNAALALADMVRQIRSGQYVPPDKALRDPREK